MADNSVLDNKRMFVIGSIRLSVSRHYLHDLQGKYMRVVVSLLKRNLGTGCLVWQIKQWELYLKMSAVQGCIYIYRWFSQQRV